MPLGVRRAFSGNNGPFRQAAIEIAAAAERLRPAQLRFVAHAIVPFESVLSPNGPRYTPLALAPLGSAG